MEANRNNEPRELRDVLEQALQLMRQAAKQVLSIDECAEYTGYAKATIYSVINRRELTHFKHGNRVFVKKADLDAWLTNPETRIPAKRELEYEAHRRTLQTQK